MGRRYSHVSDASSLLVVWALCWKGKDVVGLWHVEYSKKILKENYDPAYRGFVFYKTMSPNEVSDVAAR